MSPIQPAPARRDVTLPKSVDPMVAGACRPGSRAARPENCANRETPKFLDTHPQSHACSPPFPEHTAPNHGNVVVGRPYNRDANLRKRKLQILQASHTHDLTIRSSVVGRGRSEQTPTTVPRPTIGLEATALRTALEAPAVAGGIFSPVHGPSTELGPPGRQPECFRDPKSMMPSTETTFALTCLVLLAVLLRLFPHYLAPHALLAYCRSL
ncbi:hypothetical protein FB451DRAFT_1173060 [Mycena latifolia]|nr:hypothetical protein FB451DRAFT_1173060 [Mycena latifolia]